MTTSDETVFFTIDDLSTEDILGLLEIHNEDRYESNWARIPSSDDFIHRCNIEAILADLEDFCQQALCSLKKGSLPINDDRLGGGVLSALKQRCLVWEITEGQIELTPRGRGINPSDFILV
jgi:hypothetical protein